MPTSFLDVGEAVTKRLVIRRSCMIRTAFTAKSSSEIVTGPRVMMSAAVFVKNSWSKARRKSPSVMIPWISWASSMIARHPWPFSETSLSTSVADSDFGPNGI